MQSGTSLAAGVSGSLADSPDNRLGAPLWIFFPEKCGYPGQPVNGYVQNTKPQYYEGEAVEYRCNADHVLFGSITRVCRRNGTWSAVLPLCDKSLKTLGKAVTSEGASHPGAASALDRNPNSCAVMTTSSIHWWRVDLGAEHHVLAVRVAVGRQAQEQNFNIYVIADGEKQDSYRRCASFTGKFLIISCNDGRGIPGRYVHIEDSRSDQKYFVLCDVEIYILKEAYPCGEPEVALNSKIIRRTNRKAHYQCSKGYKMIGPRVRTCNQSGAWSGHEPACEEVVCLLLNPVPHGILRLTGKDIEKMTLGTVVKFSCHHGYVLHGSDARVCEEDGQWSGGQTKCLPIDCEVPKSSFPGEYFVMATGKTNLHSKAHLHCTDGYNKTFNSSIVCEAVGKWNYSKIATCFAIERVEEIIEEYSLHFTSGIIIGIIAMSLIILCILISLFFIKWRRRKSGSVNKARMEQTNCSLTPSASSLIARGHYTPAEEIIWSNDGFYCELPVHSIDNMCQNLNNSTKRKKSSDQISSDNPGDNNKIAVEHENNLKNGSVIKTNLNKSQPSRETIYEEISKESSSGDRPAPGHEETSSLNLERLPDDPTLPRNKSLQSISELYAKVDFDKKRESRLLNSNISSPQNPLFCTNYRKGPQSPEIEDQSKFELLPKPVGSTYRELPPIPADVESISSNSSQNNKKSKVDLAMKLLDKAVYAPDTNSIEL
ncbi:Sushi, von Willebrand factor type A, EGF and pentraxin domain-containing protein 1 [Nymphon striatum]|nr:Sushi, von Willebrand factor type A, EGF and pentraxin domain-containing protein 1 [Nymphon striatum]